LVTLCPCLHNSHNAGNALQQDQDGTDLAVNRAKKKLITPFLRNITLVLTMT
jgi:hypothetical protein